VCHYKSSPQTYLQQVEEKITRVYDLKATRIDYARNELDRLQHERQDLEDRLQLLRQTQLQASA
jgi:DNA-nicking Smr family endonuclease